MIKFELNGEGYFFRGTEISKKAYEHFKDNSELLYENVTSDGGSEVPEELSIGLYDENCHDEVIGLKLGYSSLEIDCDGEMQSIKLDDENTKKLGININIKNVNLRDFLEKKKGFFFISEEVINGTPEESTIISEENKFDPKKLSLTITNFKSTHEIRVINDIIYNDIEIDTRITSGGGDLPEFKVVKIG